MNQNETVPLLKTFPVKKRAPFLSVCKTGKAEGNFTDKENIAHF